MDEAATIRAGSTAKTEPEREEAPQLRKGAVVGRYVVLHELGRGAMGVVHAAYDPRLDRRVALKLLRDRGNRPDDIGRLLREAQTLARLDHPCVVTVHDVGEYDGHLFVAMEFVDGSTLRQWQRERPRSWREVVTVYREAARGLVAAHAAGVIHRDFKPDNAMITADGRVKVMDFGLALSDALASERPDDDPAWGASSPALASTIVGTPAYMPPEQFAHADATPASDQFSFCVALYEALVGHRPFAGDTLHELATSVSLGRARDPPRDCDAPRWLLQLVRRGLAPRPGDRHASLEALWSAIDRGLGRPRRWVLVGVGLALVGAAMGAVRAVDDPSCRQAAADLGALWSPERATEIEAALTQTGHARAAESWARARTHIDAFASEWRERNDHVCGAWKREVSPELVAERRECLDLQREHLGALLEVFAHPTTDTIGFAAVAAEGLPSPDECSKIVTVDDASPADWADDVAAAQRLTAHGRARRTAGDRTGAAAAYDEALAVLGEIDAPRARARMLAARADLAFFEGAVEAGEADLRRAQQLAAEVADGRLVAELWLERVVQLNIHRPDELDRQRHLLEAVELAVVQAGDAPVHRARLSALQGAIELDAGRFSEARQLFEASVALAESAGASAKAVASYHDLIGHASLQLGDFERAKSEITTALRLVVDAYGPAFPSAHIYHGNLGGACLMMGDRECAREHFEAIASLLDDAGDHRSPSRAHNLALMAELSRGEHDVDGMRRNAEAAVEIWRALGLEHSLDAAAARSLLAQAEREAGRLDVALALALDVQRVYERERPSGHPDSVKGLTEVSAILVALGRHDEALAAYDRVVAVREAALGPSHESVGIAVANRGQLLEDMGRHAQAHVDARRAREILDGADSRAELRAAAAFLHARTSWQAGERSSAVDLAREALQRYDRAGAELSEERRAILDWLRDHEPN